MYVRPSHRPRNAADVVELIHQNMFATLVSASSDGIIASHLPFVYDSTPGEHGTLYAHMARANVHGDVLARGEECMVIFTGPHAYISPSWYVDRATAPTWDYVAVHCHGPAIIHAPDDARRNIERLVATVEAGRPHPWSLADLHPAEIDAMLANIVSFEIPLTRIEGKFKLNQGEKPERTGAAIARLEEQGEQALADYMRRYNAL
jgi:transcriptional regulator